MSNEINCFIMVGLPGSGKSTWIQNNLSQDFEIISRDLIRIQLGYCEEGEKFKGTKEQEQKVSEIENEAIVAAIKEERSFAIDDCNLSNFREFMVNFIKEQASLSNKMVNITFVVMKTPLETCIKRRENQIAKEIIERMWRKRIKNDDLYFDNVIFA